MRDGVSPRTRPETDSSFATLAASTTTCSSVDRYSTKRLRPDAVMRQTVCGRLRSCPLTISTIFAFSSTWRWRLRLPSVSEHNCFKSPNVTPLEFEISDVNTLSRARSWITRSSPSYAKRPSLPRSSRPGVLGFIFTFSRIEKQNSRNQQLARSVRDAHRPRGESAAVPERDARKSGEQIPQPRSDHGPRKKSAQGEHAKAEDDLPNAGEHPQRTGHKAHQH